MNSHSEEITFHLLFVLAVLFFSFTFPAVVTVVDIRHFFVFKLGSFAKCPINILIANCLFQAMRFIVDIDSVVQQYL